MIAGGTDRLIDHVRRAKMRNIFATQLDEPNPEERGKSFIELHDVTYCADGLDFPVDCVVIALNLGHFEQRRGASRRHGFSAANRDA